ncbi:MAG: TrmB family transcriptional regulator [Candidatus Nanoarchaeia archaeon]
MILETLRNLGLDEKEIKIYLANLELGQSPAAVISKKSNIQRELTYVVLKRLEQKGIASHTTKNYKKYYSVIAPEEFIKQLEEKQALLQNILPELNKIRRKVATEKPSSETFEGIEGIKTVFNNILSFYEKNDDEKILLGYGSAGHFEDLLNWSFPHFIEKRKKLGIKFKGIYNKSKKGIEKKKLPLSEIRFFEKEAESPSFYLIYPNHIAIIIFNEEPLGIIINSKEIYESYKMYFHILWKSADA